MESLKLCMKKLVESVDRKHLLDESESRQDVISKILSRYHLGDLVCIVNQADKDKILPYIQVTCESLSYSSDDWLINSLAMAQTEDTKLSKSICRLVTHSFVPMFKDMEHYEFDDNDFLGVAERAHSVMRLASMLITRLNSLSSGSRIQNFLFDAIPSMSVLAVEHLQTNLWTSSQSVSMANKLMGILMEVLHVETEVDLLQYHLTGKEIQTNYKDTVLSQVFKILSEKLTRENWKKTPSLKHVFCFCVMNTKFPHMSVYLDRILPSSLLLIDDYVTENKVLGVRCLNRIVQCVSAEELRWYGRADVVYEGLRHQLYTREPNLLEVTIPALFTILKVVEKPDKMGNMENIRPLTKYDEVFQQLVHEALGESVLTLRRIYTKYLDIFVDIMGISTVRHLKQILELVENYLEVHDGPGEQAVFNVLNLLRKVIEVAWPRIPRYTAKILKVLVKFLCDVYIDDTVITMETKHQLVQDVQQILILLKRVDEGEVIKLLSSLNGLDLPISCKQMIDVVISAETQKSL